MTTTDHAIVAPAVTGDPGTRADAGGFDPALFGKAVAIVTGSRNARCSCLQRSLSISYNKAADLIERMEVQGIVSAPDDHGRRVVLSAAPDPIPQSEGGDASSKSTGPHSTDLCHQAPAPAQSAGAAADGEDDAAFIKAKEQTLWALHRWQKTMTATELCDAIFDAPAVKDALARRGARPHEPADASARSARGEVAEAVLAEREACAEIASWAHMVPPDGGSPTEGECTVAATAAARIRARLTPAAVLDRARPADKPERNDGLKQIWAKIEVGDIDPVIGFPPVTAIEFCGVRFTSAAVLDRARPAGQGEGDGWQPIATAPKDGYIIGARHDGREYRDVGKYGFEDGLKCDVWVEHEYRRSVALTHWLPLLPAPPSAAAAPPAPVSRATSAPAQDAGPAGVTEEMIEAALAAPLSYGQTVEDWVGGRDREGKPLNQHKQRRGVMRAALEAAARARTPDAGKETGR